MISQFDLFTGEPAPINLGKNDRRFIATNKSKQPNTIETVRYKYRLEDRNLIVIDKRTGQRHEHTLRGYFSIDNPMESLKHKMKLSAENSGYCLGKFLLDFMNKDEMRQELTKVMSQI